MKKIITVIGARPQFIKAAPVSRALLKTGHFAETIVHTGQHYDANMSGAFFKELDIPEPGYNLGVGSGGHGEQTGEIMKKLEPILLKERPGALMVYGDTNSTLAAAITAVKLSIPVAHVEAGLRSFNRAMPEEINRVLVDHVSSILFCPTETAIENLRHEGIAANVYKTGDVMYDAARYFGEKSRTTSVILNKLALRQAPFVLLTIHRAENTDDPVRLNSIMNAVNELSSQFKVVVPLHPRTSKMINRFGLGKLLQDLIVIEPVGFLDMIQLEKNAALIATDSGGVQKEAYFHGVPCVTLRTETEWVETIQAGWNILANPLSSGSIVDAVRKSISGPVHKTKIADYGDGNASDIVAGILHEYIK